MAKRKRKIDRRQKSLMDLIPKAPAIVPGALDVSKEIRGLLSDILKKAPKSRFEVAARMSELLGREVTKYQLDSWTAESRNKWRFPLEYVIALEVACETHDITAWLAQKRGCKLLIGEDALLAELGKIESMEQELRARKKAIKQHLKKGL